MPNEQHIYDNTNHNNIVIVPTVGLKKDEPPAKKPKLDTTPEKDATDKCDTETTTPNKATTPEKDANDNSTKSDASCVKKEIKVHSWASNYLQSIGQQAKPRMNLSLTKNNTAVGQAKAPVTQTNIANTGNWAAMNLPSQYLYPNPLSYHFQMQTSINTTQTAFCSATSLNYTGPVNYTSPINYTLPITYTAPSNYVAPINNPVPSNYSAPQNYSAAINYTASLNYTVPLNYPTPTNDTAPINYETPLNYNAPLENTAPTNYTRPLNEPIALLNEPTTPLFDEPISPLTEHTSSLNESATSLQYEPISPVSETTIPTKPEIDKQLARDSALENERLAKKSTKSKERQLPEPEKATSKTKTKIQLNLIKKKTDRYKKSNLVNVHEQRDKFKAHDKIRRDNDENIQSEKHTKTSGSVSSSKEKAVNAHESSSLKTVPNRKFTECYKSVKETSKADYSRNDRQKKLSSDHYKYQESESHKKRDTKHTKYDYNKTKIIEKMKEIRSLYERAKGTSNKKVYDYNKPSTSKIRRSRTPEPVQRKRARTDSGNVDKDRSTKKITSAKSVVQPFNKIKYPTTSTNPNSHSPERNGAGVSEHFSNVDKDRSTKKITPIKSVIQPINKIKYPTTSLGPNSHSPDKNDAGVPDNFDLRSKLSRANRYFQKNRHSKDHNMKEHDNLVVTINQPEGNIEPKPKPQPKVTVTEKRIKSKNKKYKTIKFTIKVLCQDGEGSADSHSDDSEEELNAGELASSQNDLSFLDDFNVDEIVDSLNNSQKRNINIQSKNQSSLIKNPVSKNNKLNDRLYAVLESRNDHETQVKQLDESIDCIIVEDTINTENIKIKQEYDSNINESNDCLIIDTAEIGKVKTEVLDINNESNNCVVLDAASISNIKTEQDVINETGDSCMILENTIDVISIKSESSDSVIEIKSETLEKSNDCVVVKIENHPIKIGDSTTYIFSDLESTEAQDGTTDIKTELDYIADGNDKVTCINGPDTKFNENLNLLHDEDTMEIPQLSQEFMHVEKVENTQRVDYNIISDNCHPEPITTFEAIDPEHCEIEVPIVSETIASNVEKTASNINSNTATETAYEDIERDVSKSNSNAIIIKVLEIPNIIKKEPTVISPITRNNIEIVDTIHNQDTDQHVSKTDSDTEAIKVIEIPVIKEKPLIVSPIKKKPLVEVEIIPNQNVEINIDKVSPETETASEKNISAKYISPKKAGAEKTVSESLEPVNITKENINSAHENETKKKQQPIIYVCKPEGLTIEKAIKQEIINNIEPELAHLKPKDSQAIINAVAVKAEEIIKTTKPETLNVKSKDTSKVPNTVATKLVETETRQVAKSVETETRQVAIVKKKESEEFGELKEQLESRMFEYLHERYTITSLIHEGRFSKIFKCNDSKDRNCALKLLKNTNDRISLGVEKENILQKIQRDIPKENLNIVMVINGFGFERRWALLMDYYPNNLMTVLQKSKKGFSIDQLPDLARQLIMAVMVLRNNEIVHSDIKPSHILIDESRQRLKLCGFDSCYYANTKEALPNIGTVSYRAPEIIMGFSASYSIDVWAAGAVLYEMFTKRKLFLGCFNNQILFIQLCLFGDMPADMILRSPFQTNHFDGLSFVRRFGMGGMKREIHHKFFKTHRLYELLLSSYNFFWGVSNKMSRREDLSKLYCFYELLMKMLVLDPRHRLPIEFVCANPFIKEFQ